jgi:hypothetical protein
MADYTTESKPCHPNNLGKKVSVGPRRNRRAFLMQSATTVSAIPFFVGSLTAAETPSDREPDASASNPPRLNPWRLEPIDLRRFMRLGVEHIYQGAVDRRRGCMPFVRFNLTDPPTWSRHEFWGTPHMVGRFLDALAVNAEITTISPDEEVLGGLRTLLHGSLDNQFGLPFSTLPGPDGQRTASMHHCREVLLGLVALWQWRGCEGSAALAHKFVRTIEEVTRPTGSFPATTLRQEGWAAPVPNELNLTSGRLIGALIAYYRASKDEAAIDLAKRFAETNIKETFTPEGELTPAAGDHLHSTEGTMTALLDLGVLTGEDRYFQIARRVYDVGLKPWRTSYGWAKETRDDIPFRGEANNTGDFVEAALILGHNGLPQYFRDAERFIRNGLLASQIVTTDWIVQSNETDTEDYAYSDIRRRARGAFAFTTPNGYHSYNTDLMGGALQSLAQAYRQSVSKDAAGVHVNLLFGCDTPWLSLRSKMPVEGRLEIQMRKATTLFVRLAEDVVKQDVVIQVDGQPRAAEWKDGELALGQLAPAATITILFPLSKHRTSELARGHGSFEADWIGDTIVAMKPEEGKIALY